MKHFYYSFGISLFVMILLFSQISTAENFYSLDQKTVFHKILSIQTNYATNTQYIEVKETTYPILEDALIICADRKKCDISNLSLPLDARIVLIKDENDVLSVVEIKPHVE